MTLSSQSSLARDKNETLLSSMKFDSALPGATEICDGMGRTRRSDVSLRQTTQRQSGALLATMNNEVIDLQAKEIAQLRSRVAELERLRSESASLDRAQALESRYDSLERRYDERGFQIRALKQQNSILKIQCYQLLNELGIANSSSRPHLIDDTPPPPRPPSTESIATSSSNCNATWSRAASRSNRCNQSSQTWAGELKSAASCQSQGGRCQSDGTCEDGRSIK